jgi:hypothetical protein
VIPRQPAAGRGLLQLCLLAGAATLRLRPGRSGGPGGQASTGRRGSRRGPGRRAGSAPGGPGPGSPPSGRRAAAAFGLSNKDSKIQGSPALELRVRVRVAGGVAAGGGVAAAGPE